MQRHRLGGRGVLLMRRPPRMERVGGMAVTNGEGPLAWRTGVLPKWWSQPMESLRVMAAPNGAGPLARGTGRPARPYLQVPAIGPPMGPHQ